MAKSNLRWLAAFLVTTAAVSESPAVSGERLRAHVQFLASDELEGRGVGTRAERLVTQYLATQFQLAGAAPAGQNGTFYQVVPLAGMRTGRDACWKAARQGVELTFRWQDDFVGHNRRQTPRERLEAEVVFAGFGIVAPEYEWDDYKDIDVQGRIVLLLPGEPSSSDPNLFAGEAATPYSQPGYKYDQALRRGAAAAVLIHTEAAAEASWPTVQSSWGGEGFYAPLPSGARELAFAGWIAESAAGQLVRPATLHQLRDDAGARTFQPVGLGWHARLDIPGEVRRVESRNVVAVIPGSELPLEGVVFAAHWDHLGLGPAIAGDSVYNGAIDNAAGCAVLLELARAWGALGAKPRRTAIFLASTAGEGASGGEDYYVAHPAVPPGKTVAALRFDALVPGARSLDVVAPGAGRTTLWPLVEQVARRFRLGASAADPASAPFCSPGGAFARAGIPEFALRNGDRLTGRSRDGAARFGQRVHLPSDEYHDQWELAGIQQLTSFALALGLDAANVSVLPSWNKGDEHLPVRQKSIRDAAAAPRRAQ